MKWDEAPRAGRVRLMEDHYFILRIDRVNERTAKGIAEMLEEKENQTTRVINYSGLPNYGYAVYAVPKEAWVDESMSE